MIKFDLFKDYENEIQIDCIVGWRLAVWGLQ